VAHRFGRDAEEVLPTDGLARQSLELQISLVDYGRRLQCRIAMEFRQLMVREAAQLAIEKLDGPVIGAVITVPVRLD
jgi:hypothetical protein